jgi:hypothetical protein
MTARLSCSALLVILAACLGSCEALGGAGVLTNATIIDGLKEALSVGTGNAVGQTSRPGGFANNPLLRIPLPGQLNDVAKGLRAVGMGGLLDDLEAKMNAAAEQASSQAKPIFLNAITQMTFADAKTILQGSDTEATDYFRDKTGPSLRNVYSPIVSRVMDEVGVVRQYNAVLDRFAALPFTSKPNLRLEDYVTEKALDGLFSVLASEEKKIRTDPAARVTALLQKVFAAQ